MVSMFNIIQNCQEKLDNYSIFYDFLGKPVLAMHLCILFKLLHGKPDNTKKRKKQSVIFLSMQKGITGRFPHHRAGFEGLPPELRASWKELKLSTTLCCCKWTRRFPPPSWDKNQLAEPMASVSKKKSYLH